MDSKSEIEMIHGNELEAQQKQTYQTIRSFVLTLVLNCALRLRIPDIIASSGADASLSLDEIAAHLPTKTPHLDYLSRILRCLSVHGGIFIETTNTDNILSYALTETAKLFYVTLEKSPFSCVPMCLMLTHKAFMAPWHHLHECVLEGGYPFEKAHGKDIWTYAQSDPDLNVVMNNTMAISSKTIMTQVLSCYNGFEDANTLVDIGGGNGAALTHIVKAYPHIHGINFDQPHVIITAPSIPGIEHVGGDMFKSIPSADAIFMKRILHDWSDENCVKILENCHKALPDNGKLILADAVLADDELQAAAGESTDIIRDVLMMVLSTGGRERKEHEWRTLLHHSGFSLLKIVGLPVTFGKLKIIEANKIGTCHTSCNILYPEQQIYDNEGR